MSKTRTSLFVLVAFAFGGVVAWQATTSHYNHIINQSYNDSQVGSMMLEVRTLESLRKGNITNAVEQLENDLDETLFGLIPFLEKKPDSLIEQVGIREIQKAKDYRIKFPRKTGTWIDDDVAKAFVLLDAQSKH
jgi:hypothetical protein